MSALPSLPPLPLLDGADRGYVLLRNGRRVCSAPRLIDLPVLQAGDVVWDCEISRTLDEDEIGDVCDREQDDERAGDGEVQAWLAWGVA